jgi:hypothetical protein
MKILNTLVYDRFYKPHLIYPYSYKKVRILKSKFNLINTPENNNFPILRCILQNLLK